MSRYDHKIETSLEGIEQRRVLCLAVNPKTREPVERESLEKKLKSYEKIGVGERKVGRRKEGNV